MKIFKASVIKNIAGYQNTISRIKKIINAEPGTPEYDELELLTILVEAYEKQTIQIPESDPLSIIWFIMEQRGLKQADLIGILGDKTNVSKVLNRKRPLTLDMIRRFSKEFHVPTDILIEKYSLV